MRKFIVLLLSLCSVCISAQNSIGGYAYWFNNAHQHRSIHNLSSPEMNIAANTAGLEDGFNSIHIQVFDADMKYSVPVSRFFFKKSSSSFNIAKISAYRYWFNDNIQTQQIVSVVAGAKVDFIASIDVNTLPDGINNICIQIKDDMGQWSVPLKQNFLKTNGNYISKYQYWFNTDYENAITSNFVLSETSVVSAQIDASQLPVGLNIINIRYCDKLDKWSSPISQFFIKTAGGSSESKKLSTLQYWIDDDFDEAISLEYSGNQNELILTNIDLTAITQGLHTFHVRFFDDNGKSSSVLSSHFIKSPVNNSLINGIAGFQYWFDNDFASAVNLDILHSPVILNTNYVIDFSSRPMGKTLLNYRFMDNNGLWSVVNTAEISKTISTEVETVFSSNDIKLYPNPASNNVTLNINNTTNTVLILNIYNTVGTLVKTEVLQENQQQINTANFENGVYLVEIKSLEGDFQGKQKLIIRRHD